ncbi:MAG: DsbA family protein [Gammaproteobacteria bacterium]|nr:DsbA family protein [Gammaproteobacteria bacterium]
MNLSKSPLESDRPLIVYLDFKSPYAWLALHPTQEMARELGIAVDWRPFVLDIPSYLGSARLDPSGKVEEQQRSAEQWSGVKYAYYDCRRYANLRKMKVRGTVKIWDTNLAAIGMLWARRQGDAILERYMNAVYEPFWQRELDVEDAAVIRGVLLQVGADIEGFEDYAIGTGTEENKALQAAAFDAGIFGVPTYLVHGQMYFGREHLPRIRWHLGGAQGPAPDIAYESSTAANKAREPLHPFEVCIDFANPNSYLALAPTLALAAELGLAVDWHPIQTRARKAVPIPDDESRGARHQRLRADYRANDIARYAARELTAAQNELKTGAASMAVLWLKHAAPAMVEQFVIRVFEKVWEQGLAVDSVVAVETLLQELGHTADGFSQYFATVGSEELKAAQQAMAARGVIGSPTYLLGNQPFLGRQHLPLIRARLST